MSFCFHHQGMLFPWRSSALSLKLQRDLQVNWRALTWWDFENLTLHNFKSFVCMVAGFHQQGKYLEVVTRVPVLQEY